MLSCTADTGSDGAFVEFVLNFDDRRRDFSNKLSNYPNNGFLVSI